jgi:hypothetical protein
MQNWPVSHPRTLASGRHSCEIFCFGSSPTANGAIMRANMITDDEKTGRSLYHAQTGARDLNRISIDRTCDTSEGMTCFPCVTLTERVLGFMETYHESSYE